MAESSFWERSCESCLEEQKQVKARTFCSECHQFLCEKCSNWHLRFKKSKSHHLIDLVSFTNKPYSSATNEVQLSSDLLETLTISDNTVLYSTQVAVEKKDVKTIQLPKDMQIEPSRLKVTKCLEFSIESLEDKERLNVRGLASLKDAIAVAVYRLDSTKFLRVYDRQGNFLPSTQVSQEIWGMTPVDHDTFATCGSENKVYIWNIDHKQGLSKLDDGKAFNVDSYISQGIHFNGTYYCVLEVDFNTILVLHGQKWKASKEDRPERSFWKKDSVWLGHTHG
ncbi:hypothetical protein FSP39_020837 [Pinctada imbricata]|uniref:B box-type domain-containing protein n=1 Tax=Pinctada imbricata TaxID=66713 RepID=A0AA88YM81_PINIB|nr:hypothetical protein FSP39_020837 [Pinctada imbricata]